MRKRKLFKRPRLKYDEFRVMENQKSQQKFKTIDDVKAEIDLVFNPRRHIFDDKRRND